ncbi:MAG: 4'-phosphopantetheinyl transferase superfamily protein [Clostridia bacterium]|nr:4'-phosphopantetheinyl transferase superfamily protein [Clostridia bacterium]
MIELYRTQNERVYEKLKSLLNTDREIKKTENGKPYIDGFHFSVTHTANTALIAIGDNPIGVDAEKITPRKINSILKRLTERERAEICEDIVRFLKNWVVKEAYIKMLGGTLAHDLKRLEYFGGELLCDGKKPNCNIFCSSSDDLVYAVCAQSEIPQDIKIITV